MNICRIITSKKVNFETVKKCAAKVVDPALIKGKVVQGGLVSYRVHDDDEFIPETFSMIDLDKKQGVQAVVGTLKQNTQKSEGEGDFLGSIFGQRTIKAHMESRRKYTDSFRGIFFV